MWTEDSTDGECTVATSISRSWRKYGSSAGASLERMVTAGLERIQPRVLFALEIVRFKYCCESGP